MITDKIRARLPASKHKDMFVLRVSAAEHVKNLVEVIISQGKPKQRVAATLQQIYSLAIHNKIREARELMMKTHMSSIIN